MFFVLVVVPIAGAIIAGVTPGLKKIAAGKEIKQKKTAITPKRMMTTDEIEEWNETEDADRLRELDRKATVRYLIAREAENYAKQKEAA